MSTDEQDTRFEALGELNPDALLADGYEDAYIGMTAVLGRWLAVYSVAKCISILMERDGMSAEDAIEFFESYTRGAYAGEDTPLYLDEIVSSEVGYPPTQDSEEAPAGPQAHPAQ